MQNTLGNPPYAAARIAEDDGARAHGVDDAADPLARGHRARIFIFEPLADRRILRNDRIKIIPGELAVRIRGKFGEIQRELAVFFLVLEESREIRRSGPDQTYGGD